MTHPVADSAILSKVSTTVAVKMSDKCGIFFYRSITFIVSASLLLTVASNSLYIRLRLLVQADKAGWDELPPVGSP
jgi:hypothetical protein